MGTTKAITNKPPTTKVNCPRFSSVSSLVLKLDSRLLSLTDGPPASGRPSMAATSRLALLKTASLYFSSVAKTAVVNQNQILQLPWIQLLRKIYCYSLSNQEKWESVLVGVVGFVFICMILFFHSNRLKVAGNKKNAWEAFE